MSIKAYDVVIIGGGAAGTSAGITLLQKEGLKVAVIEKGNFEGYRIGESLSPGARPLLEYLKVWDKFEASQSLSSYGSHGAWASESPVAFDFLFTTHGAGWSLDRLSFDKMLFEAFLERGGKEFLNHSFKRATLKNDQWDIEILDSEGFCKQIKASYVIDATGRQGVFAKSLKSIRIVHDKLIGLCSLGRVPDGVTLASNVMVEACEYGWWYSSPVPNNRVAVVLMSDSDIISRLNANRLSEWSKLLAAMPLTSERVGQVEFTEKPVAYAAYSSILDQPGGHRWLAIGDAAVSHDPLSSSGIPHAMGGGVQGAIVALSSLANDNKAYDAYAKSMKDDFAVYLKTHWQYYSMVKRWPDATFWKRRNTEISVNPESSIKYKKIFDVKTNYQSVHISRKTITDLIDCCQPGMLVHESISKFKKAHPQYPDQQLILGFQELIENELIELS